MLICNTYVSSFTQVCLTKPQKKKKELIQLVEKMSTGKLSNVNWGKLKNIFVPRMSHNWERTQLSLRSQYPPSGKLKAAIINRKIK